METKIRGFERDIEQIVRSLEFAREEITGRIETTGRRAAAKVIADRARITTEFRDITGRLRASIKPRVRKLQVGAQVSAIAGGPGAMQSHLVELGHGGPQPAPPHPFMRKAAMETTSEQFQAYLRAVRNEINRLRRFRRVR